MRTTKIKKNGIDSKHYNGNFKLKPKWSFLLLNVLHRCYGFHEPTHKFVTEDENGVLGFVSISDMENMRELSQAETITHLLNKIKKKNGDKY